MIYKNTITITRMILAAASAVSIIVAAALVASPAQVRAASSANLCHDSFAGVTYACPATTSEKVDGKSGGKFDRSKCYVFKDPNKGWQALVCDNKVFNSTTTIPTPGKIGDQAANTDCPKELEAQKGGCDIIERYINPLISVLSVLVGIVVVIAIVIGGIQYASARNNPQAIQAAKTRITNALLGFLAYSLLWSFIQWIMPGGVFKT